MAKIDWNALTVAPVVGAYGMTRCGTKCGPFSKSGDEPYPFKDDMDDGFHSLGSGWAACGAYLLNGEKRRLDIIAIIPAPDSVEPDATQETGVVEVEATRITLSHHLRKFSVSKLGNEFSIENEITGTLTSFDSPLAVAIARAILRMAGESK
jgi:hypothetical protein